MSCVQQSPPHHDATHDARSSCAIVQPEEYEKLGSYALIGLPTELYEKRSAPPDNAFCIRTCMPHVVFPHESKMQAGITAYLLHFGADTLRRAR